nr:splicing factor 3A subunit 2-like [Salvelinus alpinus]
MYAGQGTQRMAKRMAMSRKHQLHSPWQHRPHPLSQCLHIHHLPQDSGMEKTTIGTNLLPPSHLCPSKDQVFPNLSLPSINPNPNRPPATQPPLPQQGPGVPKPIPPKH